MAWEPVASSMISAVEYDDEESVLRVRFQTGATYEYSDVEREVYEGLMTANSKGSYFYSAIRDSYPYTRIA